MPATKPVEVGASEFMVSSVYDLLTKLLIYGNNRTKYLKLLVEIAENSSRWIWSIWGSLYKLINIALTIGSAVGIVLRLTTLTG